MKRHTMARLLVILFVLSTIALCLPTLAIAHCDTMNGPVVKAAQKALETNNVNLVLMWVSKKDESTIREIFAKANAVRKLGPEARKLADMYFFETLVRIHRASEGEPYTGLKPAEAEIEPGIEAADQAIDKGTVDDLLKHLSAEVEEGVRTRFELVTSKKTFAKDDVDSGREFVAAYVAFIHHIELLFQAATSTSGHNHGSAAKPNRDAQ